MTDTSDLSSSPDEVLRPDAIDDTELDATSPDDDALAGDDVAAGDLAGTGTDRADDRAPAERRPDIAEPAKVMRIGAMVKQLLEEVRAADLDEASRERLAEVYERSITELADALSPDLQEELRGLALPFDHDGAPSEAELRVAQAQLVGWLEGLFHGIHASLMAQQYAAQQQLQQMRQLPGQTADADPRSGPPQTGTYL
ncbi:MAG: proteasome activator [Actinomycetota bacterium]